MWGKVYAQKNWPEKDPQRKDAKKAKKNIANKSPILHLF